MIENCAGEDSQIYVKETYYIHYTTVFNKYIICYQIIFTVNPSLNMFVLHFVSHLKHQYLYQLFGRKSFYL